MQFLNLHARVICFGVGGQPSMALSLPPKVSVASYDLKGDYRGTMFGTLAQTTHVNSVAELADGSVLASLFHQGMIIRIDREDGSWQPVLEGLDHPHSVRILADDYFTVADTGRGRGLMIHLKNGKGEIEAEVMQTQIGCKIASMISAMTIG